MVRARDRAHQAAKMAIATIAPSQCRPTSTKRTLTIPAPTARASTGASGRPTIRAVSQAQAIQARGPTSQPQLSKKPCEKISASSTDSTATAAACTTATRQRIAESKSTTAILAGGRIALVAAPPTRHNRDLPGG